MARPIASLLPLALSTSQFFTFTFTKDAIMHAHYEFLACKSALAVDFLKLELIDSIHNPISPYNLYLFATIPQYSLQHTVTQHGNHDTT